MTSLRIYMVCTDTGEYHQFVSQAGRDGGDWFVLEHEDPKSNRVDLVAALHSCNVYFVRFRAT